LAEKSNNYRINMYFYPTDEDIPELAAHMREHKIQYIHASERDDLGVTREQVAAEVLKSHKAILEDPDSFKPYTDSVDEASEENFYTLPPDSPRIAELRSKLREVMENDNNEKL
jgi:hypothetical protein